MRSNQQSELHTFIHMNPLTINPESAPEHEHNIRPKCEVHDNYVTTQQAHNLIVQEPVIGLIKWLRSKGLKVCSYVEKCAEFKNQNLKKIGWYTKVLCAMEYPRVCNISKYRKNGGTLAGLYFKRCDISSKMIFWQQTIYSDQCSI